MVLAQNALVAVPAVVRFVSVVYFWLCVSVLVLLSAAAVFVWRFDGMARILDQAVVWGVGRLCEAGGKVPRRRCASRTSRRCLCRQLRQVEHRR